MSPQLLIFYLLAGIAVACAVGVITRKNPVHSALFLVVAFFAVAGIYVVLEAEFLAAVQVLVYAGGIMVLFLFVIMLVDLEERGRQPRAPLAPRALHMVAAVGLPVLTIGAILTVYRALGKVPGWGVSGDTAILRDHGGNLESVSVALFQYYALPFELASVLLLVAMIGAIVLAKSRI